MTDPRTIPIECPDCGWQGNITADRKGFAGCNPCPRCNHAENMAAHEGHPRNEGRWWPLALLAVVAVAAIAVTLIGGSHDG